MNTYQHTITKGSDTICALATPAGGAIGVIRVSGPEAIAITNRLFHSFSHSAFPKKGASSDSERGNLTGAKGYTVHYGKLTTLEGDDIDDVLVSIFRAPHSYTGEDSTEISCHGSAYILQQALQSLVDAGCRQAEPGEYTRRAYLNGKMDLSQAEAVADLVAATNRATHQMALSQLRGHFSGELTQLRHQLLKMTSLLELELDFSDHEDLEFADRTELLNLATTIDSQILRLARSFKTGKALKEGIAVAIIGKTNVGKSTLLNRLLHEDKAIVSDIGGTTRDTIEDTMVIGGIPFRFIDTAGIRKTDDQIERIGIDRALDKLAQAPIVIWLVDAQPSLGSLQDMRKRTENKSVLLVVNKCDLPAQSKVTSQLGKLFPAVKACLSVSAKTGEGIKELEDALCRIAGIPAITENDVIVTSLRHYEDLTHAHDSLSRVIEGLTHGLSADLLAEDLRITLAQLADITGGSITPQETLNNIFQHFCIGK